jgi:hypothetical protein
MGEFVKKPVLIEAWLWDGRTLRDAKVFARNNGLPLDWSIGCLKGITGLIIPTLEGDYVAQQGDWIIRGVKGEYYPCKPEIFKATYEPV